MRQHSKISLSTWAIRHPIPVLVLFLVLTTVGIAAFFNIPVNYMPSVVVPVVTIKINQPGATAVEIDNQITKKIEAAITGIQGVKHVESHVSEGVSLSTLNFYLETSFEQAVNDTREAVANIKDQLPKSILEPQIKRLELEDGPILVYSIEAPEIRQEDLSWYIDDTLTRELQTIPGVAAIKRQGGLNHEITLNLLPKKLFALGVSAADISRQLARTNIDLPSGRMTIFGTEYALRTLGNAKTIDLLNETKISLKNGHSIKLSDLGTLQDGNSEQRAIAQLDGKPVIIFQVFRSKGSSEVTVAKKVKIKLKQITQVNHNIKFKQIFSLVTLTENMYKATRWNFIEGTLLTIIVVYLFLRDKRATAIAAVAIPLSIIPTFLCFSWLGFTFNNLSLLGITLVIGVLVDDAIVEIENIHRHMREGKSPYEASLIAADEISLSVIATTLVICSVFIPVSFMKGISGQYFKQFGLTVAIAAFFSLLVARLLVPMLAAFWLKKPEKTKHRSNLWIEKYIFLITWTLNHRLKTIMYAVISIILSFGIIPFLSTSFIPYEDYSKSILNIELPNGSTLKQTDVMAQQVATVFKKHPEVEYVLTSIEENNINKAYISVKLVPPSQRTLDQRSFDKMILSELKKIPDIRINFTNVIGQKDLSIMFLGNGEEEELIHTVENVEHEIREITGLSSIRMSSNLKQPEIIITPDFSKAAMLGISVQEISDAISIATIGDIETNLAKLNVGNKQIPIRIKLEKDHNQSINTIGNLKILSNKNKSVPLSAIANFSINSGQTTIERYDSQRKIALEANLNGITLGEALHKIQALPAIKNLPSSVKVQYGGDAEVMSEVFSGFWKAIGAGLLMVYAIQVLLYKNWIQPFTRMAALPLSISGAFIILLFTGTDLSLPTIIGVLMLMGIADKNSILLVDYIFELIKRGLPCHDAIVQACKIRIYPIIMTSIAMLAGMLPIALMGGPFRSPMAITVIGGLISSTVLSLIFVPIMFSYALDFEKWLTRKLRKTNCTIYIETSVKQD